MEKESAKSNSKKHFFNKKAAIPLFIIIISLAIIGLIGYKVITETGLYNKEVMLSGNPDCATQGIGCECNDEIDNDGDSLVDADGSGGASEDPECDYWEEDDDECPSLQTLFRINEITNAHAAKAIYESYPADYYTYYYSVCYPFGTISTIRDCDGTNGVIRLVNDLTSMNMHAEKIGQNNQNYEDVCFGALSCDYAADCSALGPNYACYASLVPVDSSNLNTNLHLGRCESYPNNEKLCCYDASPFGFVPGGGRSNDNVDVMPSISGIQIPERTTFNIIAKPENMARLLQGELTYWNLYERYNKMAYTLIANGNDPIQNPIFIKTTESSGDTLQYKFEFSDNTITIERESNIIEVIPLSVCGNGARESDEECDDGNNDAEDGCSPTCTIESGWICTRVYGNLSVCVQCGNDICEFPIENHRNCQADCPTYCSDGIIQTPNSEGIREQCDDQNNINGDGCNRNCQIESGWDCNNQPSFCTFCGDNEVEGNEQCDPPGNTGSCTTPQGYQGTQTCNATCQWDACTTNQFCGDNIINGNEECDDGNVNSCDGCSGQCRNEFGYCGDNECCYDFPNRSTETPENCFTDCGVSSFLTGTKISISNNKEEKIENIKTEDLVLSFNEKTNFLTKSKVLQVFKHDADSYYVINGKIKVTAKHPIWTNGKWKKVSELKIGNALMTKDKIYQLIYSISYAEEKIKVYNLKVEDTQTYFAEGILVHNKPPIEIEPQPTTEIPNIGIEQQEGNIPQGKIVLGEGGEFGLSPPETHPLDKLITKAVKYIQDLFNK